MENSNEERGQSVLIEPENQLPEMTIKDLPEEMRAAALRLGWTKLMPVQSRGIPYLMADRDMIVQSHTGSGKTGAFLIPLIMKINPDLMAPQALVLVPTRELAVQVFKEFEVLSQGLGIQGVLVYGGVGYNAQLQGFREGAQVVIGTPGRVLDHLGRRSLSLNRLHTMVFDEADEMLSMGFYPAMRELRGYLPRERRSWMFSATMPYKVQSLAKEFLRDPEFLSLSAGHVSVNTMEHRYYVVPEMEKDLMLMRLIEMENPESAIIFCNMKREVEYLAAALQGRGYNADQISGDLDQKARERAMTRIRRRETRFLVATDVAARGIDISDLTHVFQHDVPKDVDSYIHRAGRTARAGNTGVVITLVSNMSEKTDLKKIARKYNVDFVQLEMPSEEDVAQRISERVIVLLEEKNRHADRRQRERATRLDALVRSLSENDDERGLLTLLLDEIYHTSFHAATDAPAEPPAPAPQQRSEPARESSRGRDGDRGRESDRNRDADEGRRSDGGGSARREENGEPAFGGEGTAPKKKKRKRNRKKRGSGEEPRREGGEREFSDRQNDRRSDDVARGGDDRRSDDRRDSDRRRDEESRDRDDRGRREGEERRGRDDRRESDREPRRDERSSGERSHREERRSNEERSSRTERGDRAEPIERTRREEPVASERRDDRSDERRSSDRADDRKQPEPKPESKPKPEPRVEPPVATEPVRESEPPATPAPKKRATKKKAETGEVKPAEAAAAEPATEAPKKKRATKAKATAPAKEAEAPTAAEATTAAAATAEPDAAKPKRVPRKKAEKADEEKPAKKSATKKAKK